MNRTLSRFAFTALAPFALSQAAARAVDFAREVRPIFEKSCLSCHGPAKQKSGYRLDVREVALKGGESGERAIVPHDASASPLIRHVSGEDEEMLMPPKKSDKPRLTPEQVATLRAWIDAGPDWPDEFAGVKDAKPYWSLASPNVSAEAGRWSAEWNAGAGPNPIDRFIDARLAEKGLHRSPEADRRTLIRRLTFDLTGLPPTPEDVSAFVAEENPHAYENLVNRLLASPHYGERWARHWLDIAHYADTHGFERDQRRDNAWRYRDWVIRALNSDMPYDRFLREQIAGDALRPDDPAAVTATGFLAAGPWDFVGQAETPSPVLKRLARADDLDDMVTQVMTAACAMTVNCARCHDHKLDPISQREYYALCAVFAGVKRGERDVDAGEVRRLAEEKRRLSTDIAIAKARLAQMENVGLDLAGMIGGKGGGINAATGKPQQERAGKVEGAKVNVLSEVGGEFVDGVVIPNGDGGAEIPVSTTGLKVRGVPKTSGEAWDAIRNGPVNAQRATDIGGADFNMDGHALLGLHANAAITFDLVPMRAALKAGALRFRADVGYGGRPETETIAEARVFVDGELAFVAERIGPKSGRIFVNIALPEAARFLTLMATDGGDGIGFDQIFFGDPRIAIAAPPALTAEEKAERDRLAARLAELEQQIKSQPIPTKVFAVLSEAPPAVHLLDRGDPEKPRAEVSPAALACVTNLNPDIAGAQSAEGERRRALADWITAPANPLTRRVIVNRLWHYHFGTGLVDTPSDFGTGGGKPSHPELLDWLADEFAAREWSLNAMHRLICTSATYRQASLNFADSNNRLLWRMNPRRLDAESVRDAVLAVSGKLNAEMFGPGYRDFDYAEEYAPVYKYITADKPELWRRSVYRFVVRTTTHQFLTTLDCPNPANLTPARNVTTTALQSLALLNNDFMQKQAAYFAERVKADVNNDPAAQLTRAFSLAFGRNPTAAEREAALALAQSRGLAQLCRMLLNANEFVYVD